MANWNITICKAEKKITRSKSAKFEALNETNNQLVLDSKRKGELMSYHANKY